MKMILDEELQVLLLLSTLPDSSETLAMSLNNSTSKGVLSLNVMKYTMFNKETNRKDAGIYNAQDRAMSLRT